ncbi:MAG TPA: UbiA-like polyprenyltransferase [Polyangia bacterium]|nr:UbiA-like polyprenyltransferase [Polyangia bacterium]
MSAPLANRSAAGSPSAARSPAPSAARGLGRYARLVALPHTIFALPFALGAAALAWRHGAVPFSLARLALIIVAVAAARTAAMGFNRVADRRIDAANPRTANRELPRGAVSLGGAVAVTVGAALAFVAAAALLGRTPLLLSPIALAILCGYSLAKRFTWATHLWLGVCLGGAPAGAWIAITNGFGWAPLALSIAVAAWVGGFDIIYATQDVAFDRTRGLGSIPARFGVARALLISRALHVVAVAGLVAFGVLLHLGFVYGLGVAVIAATLAYEQRIVSPNDLSRIDKAFFDLNGYVSLAFAVCAIVEAVR